MIEDIAIDAAFGVSSYVTDEGSTYILAKRNGLEGEANIDVRERMKEVGIGRSLLENASIRGVQMVIYGSLLFGIDSLVGIEDKTINLHHTMFYGLGGLKHYQAFTHLACLMGFRKTSMLMQKPLHMLLKSPLFKKKYDFEVRREP